MAAPDNLHQCISYSAADGSICYFAFSTCTLLMLVHLLCQCCSADTGKTPLGQVYTPQHQNESKSGLPDTVTGRADVRSHWLFDYCSHHRPRHHSVSAPSASPMRSGCLPRLLKTCNTFMVASLADPLAAASIAALLPDAASMLVPLAARLEPILQCVSCAASSYSRQPETSGDGGQCAAAAAQGGGRCSRGP